jgi:hypothetical protein
MPHISGRPGRASQGSAGPAEDQLAKDQKECVVPDYGVAGPTRRYALIVAMLVGLTSVPTLTLIVIGSASVRQGERGPGTAPLLGPRPQAPVVVVPDGSGEPPPDGVAASRPVTAKPTAAAMPTGTGGGQTARKSPAGRRPEQARTAVATNKPAVPPQNAATPAAPPASDDPHPERTCWRHRHRDRDRDRTGGRRGRDHDRDNHRDHDHGGDDHGGDDHGGHDSGRHHGGRGHGTRG